MKILLTAINAKYIHSNLAVYSLRASSGPYRERVVVAEFTINNRREAILQELYRRKPDILCFSCYIWNLDYVEFLAREFHKLCPKVPIWVGGPEVSYEVEDFLSTHEAITGVVMGEGEETFRELCAYYAEAESRAVQGKQIEPEGGMPAERWTELEKIAGIAFRREGEIYVTGERNPLDMSRLPFCYEDMEDFANRIVYYESSRGCPFSCSYCLSSVDRRLRFRDLELVKKELSFFLDKRVPQVKFVDRTFNCNHAHAMEIWKFLKENDNGVTNFHFEISADLINEEELALIGQMRPGLIQLEIGVQSTNEDTIREIHRTMKLERVKEVVTRIRSFGNVHQHLDLIAGLPYEDYASFRRSFDEIFDLWPNQLQLGFLKVLKGSYMHQHAAEYGATYLETPPYEVLCTKWLSYEQVLLIRQVEEMLEVYYNSGQYEITMKLLYAASESAFEFFLELGELYEKKGYFGMNHSRIRRCEILMEFLQEGKTHWQKEGVEGKQLFDMVREALVFDLYYRENSKTRPSWAGDMGAYKDMSRRYCQKGSLSHLEPFHYRFPDKGELLKTGLPKRLEEPVWVLFHYDDRSPLDHQARVEVVN